MTITIQNLRNTVKTITFIFMIFVVFSCYERIDCPAYPEKYLNWLPYKADETYSFTNGTDTVDFIVNKVDISHAYRMVKYPKNTCDCSANIETSTIEGYPKFIFSGIYEESSDEKGNRYCYAIETDYNEGSNFWFLFRNGNLSLLYASSFEISLMSSYNNGFNTYFNVIKIATDTSMLLESIDEIYIAEIEGLIPYKVRSSHQTWSLIGEN